MKAAANSNNFLQRTRHARKVMVLDLGLLGDTVHLLPALWMVRQAYQNAELHVMVAAHITSLMNCTPWVDKVWGYTRFPRRANLRENLRLISLLRREKFDVIINLNGSDRSSWLTFLSGARERLGRLPGNGGPVFWKRMFTAHVYHPFGQDPTYVQRCRCLESAGFPQAQPEFRVQIDPAWLQPAGITESDRESYFHLSPFTTDDGKELSPEQFAELTGALFRAFPEKKLVLSCAPNEREQAKLEKLLPLLPQRPWRVLNGNLKLYQLAAVIQHSALHFCGDSGPLHLAMMTQTPTVAWFWPNPGIREWMPVNGPFHTIVGTHEPDNAHIGKISTANLVAAAQSVLNSIKKSPA